MLFGAGLLSSFLEGSPNPTGEGHSYFKLLTGVGITQTGMEGAGRGQADIPQPPKTFYLCRE